MHCRDIVIPLLALLAACEPNKPTVDGQTGRVTARTGSPLSRAAFATTDGALALDNLAGQIDGENRLARYAPLTAKQRAGIIDLIGMRGQFVGRIADYEQAAALADQLVRERPSDGVSFVARAAARSTFHRFAEALDDLSTAESLGVPPLQTERLRAAIFQATGRYDEALAIRRRHAADRQDLAAMGAEASLLAERGDIDAAEQLFRDAQFHYRDVSPFPVAWLYFQQGLMWMREGDLVRARTLFAAAQERLPAYAAAQGHLAEVEAALGNRDRAIALLQPLAASSDDPDYAAQLARILGDAGRDRDARRWRDVAARRYDALVNVHPLAFADHAAEFWLAAGGDSDRALALAERNLANRATARAYELVLHAAVASGNARVACDAALKVQGVHQWPSLSYWATRGAAQCEAS